LRALHTPNCWILLGISCVLFGRFTFAQAPAPFENITADRSLARIERSAPALASFGNEVGRVEPNRALPRMVLGLSPPPEKQHALVKFLDDQQNRRSPDFHHWLSAAEFGARFGTADTDAEAVRQWLQKSGFQVAPASQGKLWVEFSGTAQQVENAFHTELHYYEWGGKKYLANATDIAIPAQFAKFRAGGSLNSFGKRPPRLLTNARTRTNLRRAGNRMLLPAPGDFSTTSTGPLSGSLTAQESQRGYGAMQDSIAGRRRFGRFCHLAAE
jgi:hypothetical protein